MHDCTFSIRVFYWCLFTHSVCVCFTWKPKLNRKNVAYKITLLYCLENSHSPSLITNVIRSMFIKKKNKFIVILYVKTISILTFYNHCLLAILSISIKIRIIFTIRKSPAQFSLILQYNHALSMCVRCCDLSL